MPPKPDGSSSEEIRNKRLIGSVPMWHDEAFEDFVFAFDTFTSLNKIDGSEEVKLFLLGLGSKARRVNDLCNRDESEALTLVEVKKKAAELYAPSANKFASRMMFHKRVQKDGETVAQFASDLKYCSNECKWNATEAELNLKSQFVSGVTSTETKKKLYVSAEIKSFNQLVDEAILEEAMEKSARKDFKVNGDSSGVNRVDGAKGRYKKQQSASKSDRKPKKRFEGKCRNCEKPGHKKRECRNCFICKKPGHIARNCNTKVDQVQDEYLLINNIETVINKNSRKLYVNLFFSGAPRVVRMECDTGSVHTIMARVDVETWQDLQWRRAPEGLRSASGHSLKVCGLINRTVECNGKRAEIDVVIVSSPFSPILGTDALDKLFPRWREAFLCNSVKTLESEQFEREFQDVFEESVEPIKKFKCRLHMKDVEPVLARPYSVPPAMASKMKVELDRLVKEGILYAVEQTEWASPVVVVPKKNNTLRLCIDPSRTVNPGLICDHYPLPKIEHIWMKLANKKWFSLIDLRGAYQQLMIDEKSQHLLTINTPYGLFRYRRMPFGIKPAPAIFQKVMEKMLADLSVIIYLDDILVATETVEQMQELLIRILERLREFNVKVNKEKTVWCVSQIEYLGHTVSDKGLGANQDKIKAMQEASEPQNKKEVQSFVGLVGYYAKFIPRLNEMLKPIFELTKNGVKWDWSSEHRKAFDDIKKKLAECQILAHFDAKKEVLLSVDASDKGICGVLCQLEEGLERPVFWFSRVISETEKRYPIIHREALAVVYGLERCWDYIYGLHVTVFTDHRPLLGIFNKGLPAVIVSRLQRYLIRASIFDFTLKYKKGALNYLADFGSRHPSQEKPSMLDKLEEERACINRIVIEEKLNKELMTQETDKDEFLHKLKEYIKVGWPEPLPKEWKQWFNKRFLLDVVDGCVFLDERMWIPAALRGQMIKLLHKGHRGASKMKMIAARDVYWPKMMEELEHYTRSCEVCVQSMKKREKDVFCEWIKAKEPWERVHVDFFHFGGKVFLLMVDAYSRWLEIKHMKTTEAYMVNHVLGLIFDVFGDPKILVADNGPPFASREFEEFLKERDVKLVHSPPYHPQSNGLAERHVGVAKLFLKKDLLRGSEFGDRAICEFLKNFRNTPGPSGYTPAELMFNFSPRIDSRKFKKSVVSISTPNQVYKDGEVAWYRTAADPMRKREKCTVLRQESKMMYLISIDGKRKTAHINQLSKVVLPHRLYDAFEPMFYRFEQGSEKPSKPQEDAPRRSGRNRKPPQRYQAGHK